ncbi:MAG: hypothetical protein ACR2I8_00295 [Steroidobacteraceae bacterium]
MRGDVVVLFSQAERSFRQLNPNGCWDWWGYLLGAAGDETTTE